MACLEKLRVVHALSALLTGGCILLTAVYVFTRVEMHNCSTVAVMATLFGSLNCYVNSFGNRGFAVWVLPFFYVAAFFLIAESVDKP